MDERRLSTGDVLALGIVNRSLPVTDVPEDRERAGVDVYEDCTVENVSALLLAGKVVSCSEYYGIPIVWQTDQGFNAILLQYRRVSEKHLFATVGEAAEWFVETAFAVAG